MFIFNLTYIKPILEVEKMLPAHITYLIVNHKVIFDYLFKSSYMPV